MTVLQDCSPTTAAQANRAVVDKAFALLEAWDHRGETLGVSELARRTGLPKSTSHRLLGILEAAGVVQRLASSYRLGDRLHDFTNMLVSAIPPQLREVSLPFLQDLYELTHETIHLAALDGTDVHCVDKIYGHRRTPVQSRVGSVVPTHSTALGKVLVAYSPTATQRAVLTGDLPGYTPATVTQPLRLTAEFRATLRHGLAYDRGETHQDVTCVAAPVLNRQGQALAAISISGPANRFDPHTVVERLRRTARAASLALASAHVQTAVA
jgi:IclR family KDG regulon transcriptional repressor